jgi:hypothetical protein
VVPATNLDRSPRLARGSTTEPPAACCPEAQPWLPVPERPGNGRAFGPKPTPSAGRRGFAYVLAGAQPRQTYRSKSDRPRKRVSGDAMTGPSERTALGAWKSPLTLGYRSCVAARNAQCEVAWAEAMPQAGIFHPDAFPPFVVLLIPCCEPDHRESRPHDRDRVIARLGPWDPSEGDEGPSRPRRSVDLPRFGATRSKSVPVTPISHSSLIPSDAV